MRLKLLLITIALFLGFGMSYGQITEGFESSTPPPPGWTYTSVTHGTNNPRSGSRCATFKANNDEIITPLITSPNQLSFWWRRSGTAPGSPIFIVFYSANSSGPWTQIGTNITSFTATYQEFTANLSALSNIYIRVVHTRTSGANEVYLDDFSVTASASNPTVTTLSPADNTSGVSTTGDLSIVFNKNVVKGTGNILIRRSSDNSIFETIAVTSGLVTVSGATITINPAGTFSNSTGYYVEIPAGAIEDTTGNDYAGISGTTAWNFTTEAIWTNPITDSNPSTANPYTTGQTFNANITVSGISRGTGIAANPGGNRYNANDWNSGSLNPNDYFEFTLTPNAGYEINFSDFVYTSERSGNASEGLTNFAFRSIVDSFGANIVTPNSSGATISLSGAAYQNRTAATTFRIYAWGADATGRTFSINDFTFNGTVIQTTLATDYFRSTATGVWSAASNWESSRDNTNWITSTLVPTSAANTITIRDTHTITISSAVTADQITVLSGGTLALNGANLTLDNGTGTDLTIASGGTFDNGGENFITRNGTPSISISGTFITRDAQGFVGTNTAIPDISTTLIAGSNVEYGLNGDQAVQGLTAPNYSNVTFSGSGTKTLQSTNAVTGTVTIKDTAIFNNASFNFGGAGTNLTMTDTSRLIVSGARPLPDMEGTYTLTGGTIEFAGNSNSHTARSPITYNNVVISGANVNGSAGNYTLRNGATFTVNAGGVFTVSDQRIIAGGASATVNINGTFVTRDVDGFYGSGLTSISPTNTILNLGSASTIEYAGANQSIATVPVTTAYANITISGTGTKTIPTQLFLGNNLSVNASTLRIESGKALTVTNNVVVNPGSTMTINDSGSLVQVNDAAVNSGNIRYERTTPLVTNTDYTYWSSPVADYTLGGVSQNLTVADKYYSYNSAVGVDGDWEQASAATPMIPGIGYIIRGPEPSGSNPPAIANFDAFFVGKPNNGQYTISGLSTDKSYLLGNPYPSALDADTFLDDNSDVLDGTLYFWTHITPLDIGVSNPGTGYYAYSRDDYAAYNPVGGVGVDDISFDPGGDPAPSGGAKPSGKIASGQGFFASSKTSLSGSPIQILYNNSMRVGVVNIINENNSQFFRTKNPKTKTATIEKHRIWLNLRNTQGVFKQTLIGYLTEATNQYDNRFDGISFDANEFADFYSVNQDKNLVIQGRALPFDENDEVPLGFRTTIDGAFTINIDQADGVLTNQAVFIEDKLTNTIFDLRTGPFTFNTAAGTFNDRFVLRYTNKTLGTIDLETDENQVLVSNKNKQIKINSTVEIIDKVTVYDLLGRQLFKKEKVNNNELVIPNLISSQQTLLVKVTLQNGQTVTKKIIN